MNQAVQHQPEGGLRIRDGYAEIPAWGWDSHQSTILGIPVLVDVNATIPVIPDGGQIKPSLYLTFTNGWVLAFNTPFSDLQAGFSEMPPFVFGSFYLGEGNHVFDLKSFNRIERPLAELAELEAVIHDVANFPFINRDDLIATYIDTDPYRPGVADAILTDSGVHVWAIMGAILLTGATPDEVARDYDVLREAVDAAIAYYRRYRPIIIARITANNVGAA
jgi:uncharacterized protein (DUF433 family)